YEQGKMEKLMPTANQKHIEENVPITEWNNPYFEVKELVQKQLPLPGELPVFKKQLVHIPSSVKTPQADGLGCNRLRLSGRRS
ncbi:MAG: hypothetical protein J6I89_01810, partial [Oscillospiraceae bacterium]|nr:hypothetical protein [Oscillospiraceae bacterium]